MQTYHYTLATNQKVGGSSPFQRTIIALCTIWYTELLFFYPVRWKGLEGERAKRGVRSRFECRQKRHGMAFLARAQMKRICSLNGKKRGIRSRFAETLFQRTT